MLMKAPTEHDKNEWINAFRFHQYQVLEARTAFFEKKLERAGVKVPRGSILLTHGFNAPLQATAALRTRSEVVGLSTNSSLMPLPEEAN